jgi:DNA polymerase-3 subunit epsilon
MKNNQYTTDLKVFDWWGRGNNPPPENLKTRKQLSEIGLSPLNPVGVIYRRKGDVYLYDPENPQSAKPKRKLSPKQLETLAKGREERQFESAYKEWYFDFGRELRDRGNSIIECQKILSKPDSHVILDTETTGIMFANVEILQIGIINLLGDVLFDSLVKPTIPIPKEASDIHRITDDMVKESPSFDLIYPRIKAILEGKTICIYNAYFEQGVFERCCYRYKKPKLINCDNSICIMKSYAEFYGDWNGRERYYNYQELNGDHSAIGDCRATLELIKLMASCEVVDTSREGYKKIYYGVSENANG